MKHANEFLKLVDDSKTRIREISVEETAALQMARENFLLVDVREDREWQAGHVAGAVHIGKGVIERDIENAVPDKNAKIVLYCGGGFRSALAADSLQKMGYSNVLSMAGGWRDWVAKGLPRE